MNSNSILYISIAAILISGILSVGYVKQNSEKVKAEIKKEEIRLEISKVYKKDIAEIVKEVMSEDYIITRKN